jgi:hypothetical protein
MASFKVHPTPPYFQALPMIVWQKFSGLCGERFPTTFSEGSFRIETTRSAASIRGSQRPESGTIIPELLFSGYCSTDCGCGVAREEALRSPEF